MENIMIYPYTGEELHLVEYFMEIGYNVTPVVLKGSVLSGKNFGYKKNKLKINNVICTDNLDLSLEESTMIYICDNEYYYDCIVELLNKLKGCNKKIICSLKLKEIDYQNFINYIKYLPFEKKEDKYFDKDELFQFYTPVVAVANIFKGLDDIELFFKIVCRLKDKHLNISGLGYHNDCRILGLHTFEECGFDGRISRESIIQLNHFLKHIENEEHPDIIVIQFPEPLLKYDENITFDFGISAYGISQAITPDYAICCTTMSNANEQYWENFNDIISKKYGFLIDSIFISNISIEANEMKAPGVSPLFHIPIDEEIIQINNFCKSGLNINDQYVNLINQIEQSVFKKGITFI